MTTVRVKVPVATKTADAAATTTDAAPTARTVAAVISTAATSVAPVAAAIDAAHRVADAPHLDRRGPVGAPAACADPSHGGWGRVGGTSASAAAATGWR